MGRRLCTDIPQVSNLLIPDWPHLQGFEEKDRKYKQQQKEQYDSRHRVRPLTPLPNDTDVWVNVQGRECTWKSQLYLFHSTILHHGDTNR